MRRQLGFLSSLTIQPNMSIGDRVDDLIGEFERLRNLLSETQSADAVNRWQWTE